MKWRYKCKIHISMKYWNKDFVSIFDTNMYVGFVSLYFNHNPDYNIVTLIFSLLIQVCYHIYFLLRYTTCVWYYPTRWNAYSMVLGWDIEVMYVKEIAGSEKYLWLCSMKECQIFYIKWDIHFAQTFYYMLNWNQSKWFRDENILDKNCSVLHPYRKGSLWCMLKYTCKSLIFP